jgi:hypothetical protein
MNKSRREIVQRMEIFPIQGKNLLHWAAAVLQQAFVFPTANDGRSDAVTGKDQATMPFHCGGA